MTSGVHHLHLGDLPVCDAGLAASCVWEADFPAWLWFIKTSGADHVLEVLRGQESAPANCRGDATYDGRVLCQHPADSADTVVM